MTEVEVTQVVKAILLDYFPETCIIRSLMCCHRSVCKSHDCRGCLFRPADVSEWEMGRILPAIEEHFNRKCTLQTLEFYAVVKYYADS